MNQNTFIQSRGHFGCPAVYSHNHSHAHFDKGIRQVRNTSSLPPKDSPEKFFWKAKKTYIEFLNVLCEICLAPRTSLQKSQNDKKIRPLSFQDLMISLIEDLKFSKITEVTSVTFSLLFSSSMLVLGISALSVGTCGIGFVVVAAVGAAIAGADFLCSLKSNCKLGSHSLANLCDFILSRTNMTDQTKVAIAFALETAITFSIAVALGSLCPPAMPFIVMVLMPYLLKPLLVQFIFNLGDVYPELNTAEQAEKMLNEKLKVISGIEEVYQTEFTNLFGSNPLQKKTDIAGRAGLFGISVFLLVSAIVTTVSLSTFGVLPIAVLAACAVQVLIRTGDLFYAIKGGGRIRQ